MNLINCHWILVILFLNQSALANTGIGVAPKNPQEETLSISADGAIEINEAPYFEGDAKSASIYAEVSKVLDGSEAGVILYIRPLEVRTVGPSGKIQKWNISGELRPFSPEEAWKLLDAQGKKITDPHLATHVILPYFTGANAAVVEAIWNECDGPITGNYLGSSCAKKRFLSDDYMAFLKMNLLSCVNAGLEKNGLESAAKVHILHDGTSADSRHSGTSLHSAGRAIDIVTVTTSSIDGKKNSFEFKKTNTNRVISKSCAPANSENCKFFEAFRSCWHQVHVKRRCPGRKSGPIGTIGWEQKDHIAHHLHTSMPFCPNSKGFAITQTLP